MITRLRRMVLASAVAFALAPAPAPAAETVLVSAGSSMSHRANATNPGIGTTWTAEAFTPSGWSAGTYGAGYETSAAGATSLLATTVASTSRSLYTRATFSIANVSAVDNLFLGADYDDGYVAWINGVEVFRSAQMPAGAPQWNTVATSHESSNAASPDYGTLTDISATALPVLHNGVNVLAIGVWNTTLPSTDLVLVPRLSMNREATVTRGPYLQLGTPTSVTVRWRTSPAGNSCVRYGTTPGNLALSSCLGASTTEHVVNVTGLAPDTKYYYSVGTSTGVLAGNSPEHFFVTSPPAGASKPTRVWVLGDSGTADSNAAAVRDAYLAYTGIVPTDLWLMLGDNAYESGTDAEYQAAVFNMYPTMLRRSVLWPTLGNHDGFTANSATQTGPYYNMFTLPTGAQAGGVASGTEAYYSFDYGNIHFICLESYETYRGAGGAMMTWLLADLADTTAEWIVAFFHHPPYSRGSHDSDTEIELIEMRENALPLLEQNGVDLVLTGHSHSYERSYLIDGHYDDSSTFEATMKIDGGSGREDGTGAYQKDGGGPVSHQGAVYVVAGSSGRPEPGPLDHPAMYVSMSTLGSVVLDFEGTRLDSQFLDSNGVLRDYFTIDKTPSGSTCDDGICDAGEDCDACPADCGTCTAPLLCLEASDGGVFSGAMTATAQYAGGADLDPNRDSIASSLVFANSTKNALNGGSSDKVSYAISLPSSGTWNLWGRLYYPGAPGSNDANSFLVNVDGGTRKKFGNNLGFFRTWHWDGEGNLEADAPAPLSLGSLSAGQHQLVVEKREVTPVAPRLDVLCLSQDTGPPTDAQACAAIPGCNPGVTTTTSSTTTTTTLPPLPDTVCIRTGGTQPAGTFNGAMTKGTQFTGGTDSDPLANNLTTPLVFANSTVNALSGGSADWVTYTVTLPSAGSWFLWGRFYYPDAAGSNGGNSFHARVGNAPLKKFGNHLDFFRTWHWDGEGQIETGARTGLALGTLAAGSHVLRIEKREVLPTPPRLDVLCLTKNGSTPPTDSIACAALGGCP